MILMTNGHGARFTNGPLSNAEGRVNHTPLVAGRNFADNTWGLTGGEHAEFFRRGSYRQANRTPGSRN